MNNNITIGSDPEFVIMCGDNVGNALEIFSKVFEEDLSCIEPEEPRLDEIKNVYYNNPASYINNALNNIQLKAIYKQHPRFAAEILIDTLKKQHTIEKIIAIFNITKKELDESMSEILLVPEKSELYIHKSYGEMQFHELPLHIKSRILWITIKNRMLYKNMDIEIYIPDEKKEEFKNRYIDKVIKYYSQYSEAGFPNLENLSQIISEYIKDDIIENWEYDFSPDNDDYAKHFCSAEIGCDGHSITGEMRPRQGNNPIEHFNEILKLIKELSDALEPEIICYDKELQVKAGTIQGLEWEEETILLGGHIHIGYDVESQVYIAKWLGTMLSIFAGIPLTLIEKPEEIHKRHKIYGKFNDIRPKEYGIEFRMPSSWLVSPEITIGALALTYVVADEFITKYKSKEKSSSIDLLFEDTKRYEDIYNSLIKDDFDWIRQLDYDKLIAISETLYKNIKTMRLYPEYAEYIDYIFDMIKNREYWNSDVDILTTWSKLF